MTPLVLAIESSQREAGVALSGPDGSVMSERVSGAARHDDDLLPAIDRLLERAGVAPSELRAVGISVGPGGFTGLRIAVTTAKMFAETLGVALVAVPSAAAVAETCDLRGPILVALACKDGTFWGTPFARQADRWRAAADGRLMNERDEALARAQAVVADAHLPDVVRARCAQLDVPIIEPVFDAVACLTVACRQLERNDTVDALTLRPIYPRPPAAVLLWDRPR